MARLENGTRIKLCKVTIRTLKFRLTTGVIYDKVRSTKEVGGNDSGDGKSVRNWSALDAITPLQIGDMTSKSLQFHYPIGENYERNGRV